PLLLLDRTPLPPHLPPSPTRRSSDLHHRVQRPRVRAVFPPGRHPVFHRADGGGRPGRRGADGSRPPEGSGGRKGRDHGGGGPAPDRKSTRLNSSHVSISYAVFCLKEK